MNVEETGEIQIADELGKAEIDEKFVNFIQLRKVVMLEDLAAEFKMLTKEVVAKIEQLETNGTLTGITDDRGKYIHITPEEFNHVSEFIKKSGRVNRAELHKEASKAIRLIPTEQDKELLKQEQQDLLSKVEKTIGSDKK